MKFCDPDIEKAFLGAFCTDPDLVSENCSDITPEHFFVPANKQFYATLLALRAEGIPINDLAIISAALERDYGPTTDWAVFATDIITSVATAVNAPFHADDLRDWRARRQVAALVTDWAAMVNGEDHASRGIDLLHSLCSEVENIKAAANKEMSDRTMREREAVVLSCIVQSTSDVVVDKISLLSDGCFRRPCNQRIFSELNALILLSKSYMLSDFLDHIRHHGLLDKCGGEGYVVSLYRRKITDVDYAQICERMREDMARESLMVAARDISNAAGDSAMSASDLCEYAESRIMEIDISRSEEYQTESAAGVIADVMNNLEKKILRLREGGINGVQTGLETLDRTLDGLKPGHVIVVAARPGCGKTSLGLQIAIDAAMRQKVRTLFFSKEMKNSELLERAVCSLANTSLTKATFRGFSQQQMQSLMNAARDISEAKLKLNDKPDMGMPYIRAVATREHRRDPLGLIVIDYLQLLEPEKVSKSQNREREVAKISVDIKKLARTLGVPIVVLAQLNRSSDAGKPRKPKKSDLRESGAIEQDADVVMLIHSEDASSESENDQGVSEICIDKHRGGPTMGYRKFRYVKEFTRFEEMQYGHH